MAAANPLSLKKKSVSEQKREAIIAAAREAFQQHGVEGTSMDKVAEIAGVSKRTVYNHFSTKEDLVLFLISDMWRQSMAQVDIEYLSDEALESQLAALLDAEVELVASSEFIGLARIAAEHFMYHTKLLQEKVAELSVADLS